MFLERFKEPIVIGEREIKSGYPTYRMDRRENPAADEMRKAADLGSCHCCDYVVITDKEIILIEDTDVMGQAQSMREKYRYLNENDKDKHVGNCIRDENRLKAYGAMLILCRLAGKYAKVATLFADKKYRFWLVAHTIESSENWMYFDSVKDSWKKDLHDVIGGALSAGAEVLTIDYLKNRLRAPSP